MPDPRAKPNHSPTVGIGMPVFNGEAFAPTIMREIPAGQYLLDVTIQPPTPPFKDVRDLIVAALPPKCGVTVKVGS